jgi:hypothetical protein
MKLNSRDSGWDRRHELAQARSWRINLRPCFAFSGHGFKTWHELLIVKMRAYGCALLFVSR